MPEKHKIKVGQEVFIERRGKDPGVDTYKVEKVGRKFFYLKAEYGRSTKFDLETLCEVTEWGCSRVCYLSLQDLADLLERRRCFGVLQTAFSRVYSLRDEMTLDKLSRMVAIWEEE